MFKHYVLAFAVAITSFTALAENEPTYKDDIPTVLTQLGEHKLLDIVAYKVNKKDEEFIPSESKAPEVIQVDTDVSDLSKFEYYLRADGNVITRLTYSNEKVYKTDILVKAINFKTEYRYPSYVISSERQYDFYKHDLVDYLISTGWENKGVFENEYTKDNYLVKITHSADYAIVLEFTTRDLITELNAIKLDIDSYKEDDEYLKGVYKSLITIEK